MFGHVCTTSLLSVVGKVSPALIAPSSYVRILIKNSNFDGLIY